MHKSTTNIDVFITNGAGGAPAQISAMNVFRLVIAENDLYLGLFERVTQM